MSEMKTLFIGETPDAGTIRLAEWPEGFVLWYHGEIVWRSWDTPHPKIKNQLILSISLDPSDDLSAAVAELSGLLVKAGQ